MRLLTYYALRLMFSHPKGFGVKSCRQKKKLGISPCRGEKHEGSFLHLADAIVVRPGVAQQASQSDLQQLEARLANEIKLLGVKIDEMDKRLNNRIDEMDKRIVAQFNAHEHSISMVQWTLNLLLIIIVIVLGVPYVVRSIREQEDQRKNAELRERELAALREEFKQVTNDMGVLKQQLQKLNEVVLPPSKQG